MSRKRPLTDDEYLVLARAYLHDEHVPRELVQEVAPLSAGEIFMLAVLIEEMGGEL